MGLLEDLIAASQAAFPDAFQEAAGPSGFSLLSPEIQVATVEAVTERAALTRSIFPTGTTGLTEFIKQQSLDITNLFKLGSASVDITTALNEQITIREDQLARTQESIRNNQILQTNINESFTNTLGDISNALGDIGKGGFDPIKFFTDNPLLGGIGVGGLLVGGVVLFLVLKR